LLSKYVYVLIAAVHFVLCLAESIYLLSMNDASAEYTCEREKEKEREREEVV